MNVLVLSAGGPAAVGVIKSLRDMNFDGKIVAIDCDELAVGFQLADVYYVVPRADDDDFNSKLWDILLKEMIDLILPTGPEILSISNTVLEFGTIDVKLFMSDYDTIKLCNDKLEFYNKCKDKFPLPNTFRGSKLFKKPINGSGSRGCEIIEFNSDEIISEYLPGQEYTIDVLCDMESDPLVVIPRKRLQTKAGISSKGEIIRDNFIEKACFDMCKFLKLKGPVCLQMKEDKDGKPKFVEVNPRFGGGTYFTTLAGVNFCKLIIDMLNGKELNIPKPKPITVLRYFEEIVI